MDHPYWSSQCHWRRLQQCSIQWSPCLLWSTAHILLQTTVAASTRPSHIQCTLLAEGNQAELERPASPPALCADNPGARIQGAALKFYCAEGPAVARFDRECAIYERFQEPYLRPEASQYLPAILDVYPSDTTVTGSAGDALPPCLVMEQGSYSLQAGRLLHNFTMNNSA